MILLPLSSGLSQPPASGSSLPSSDLPVAKPANEGPVQTLTLADALALAEKNSPRLHAAVARVDRAAAATMTAKAYTNPDVQVYAGHQSALDVAIPGPPGLLQHYRSEE